MDNFEGDQRDMTESIQSHFPGATVEFADVAPLFPVTVENAHARSSGRRRTSSGTRALRSMGNYAARSRRTEF